MSRRPTRRVAVWVVGLLAVGLTACKHETYESGDGEYSYLQAHYVEAATNGNSQFVQALTDDNARLAFTKPVKAAWATTPDSTYRALLYHKQVAADGTTEPFSLRRVSVVKLRPRVEGEALGMDPVVFESAWISENHKYLNIAFGLKTGRTADGKARQTVDLVLVRERRLPDGTAERSVAFSHRQNKVPEYYTTHHVVSMPLEGFQGTINLTVHSYKGTVGKLLTIPRQ